MAQVRGDGNMRSQQIRLGRALQGARDRVFADLQVVIVGVDRTKRTVYSLRRVSTGPEPDAPDARAIIDAAL